MSINLLRGAVRSALVLALGAALLPPAASAATTLTVGKAAPNADPIIPVDVGFQAGIFKKHGLDLKIVDFLGGSKMAQAMAAGSLDIGDGAGTEMALVAKGVPMLAICESSSTFPFLSIAVPWDSPVKSLKGLKGKKIGISSAGSLTDWLASELARQRGWGPDGVTEVAIGNSITAIIAAFRTHAIDADIPVTSDIFEMEEKHEGRLLIPVSSYVGNVAAGTIFATKQAIAKNPDGIRRFLAAWLETIDIMRKNKAETVKIESAVTGFSPEVMSQEYDLTIRMFSNDCKFDAESIANLKRSFIDLKLVDKSIDMSKLYTEEFVPK
jgi:ABC-type nitrate/sulfonate/bicarbonate transport system substrate-binding protein